MVNNKHSYGGENLLVNEYAKIEGKRVGLDRIRPTLLIQYMLSCLNVSPISGKSY